MSTFKHTLQRVWERWKAIAARISNVQVRVLLGIVYCTVIPFFAVLYRLQLRAKRRRSSAWESAGSPDGSLQREW